MLFTLLQIVILDLGRDGFLITSRTSKLPLLDRFWAIALLAVGSTNVIGRGVQSFYPMRDYIYLGEWPLPPCDHPVEWV